MQSQMINFPRQQQQEQQEQTVVVEFHGIKSEYSLGETMSCYFTVPEVCQPVRGNDWIGIIPIGWTSIRECIYKKMAQTEGVTGVYGKVEFESMMMPRFFGCDKYYQFVYVKDGECVMGMSTPFMLTTGTTCTTGIETPLSMINGEQFWQPMQPKTLGQVVEREMQKLQREITCMQQMNVMPVIGETSTTISHFQFKQHLQTKLRQLEQLLKHKMQMEQCERRFEQFHMLGQLKECERHIEHVQKREHEIREFLLRERVQQKVAEFERKIRQVVVARGEPIEHHVRKYEQLLKEKIELDMQKRVAVFYKLRQTIKECERKLRHFQTIGQEHSTTFHRELKNKLEQFETKMTLTKTISSFSPMELSKHFEPIMTPFLMECEKVATKLHTVHQEMHRIVKDICMGLKDLELSVYSTLRIPKIGSWFTTYTSQPRHIQIAQLEKKIAERKWALNMMPSMTSTPFESTIFRHESTEKLSQMLELVEMEKKIVAMKAMNLFTFHYELIEQRLAELEHHCRIIKNSERCIEQFNKLRRVLAEHIECLPTISFTMPEEFYMHQRKYEQLWSTITEFEGHIMQQTRRCTGALQTPFVGLEHIERQFFKLVQEFQIQFPECFGPKVEQIEKFLVVRPGQYFGGKVVEKLVEKLAEFETILCQPECEIACLTASIYPQTGLFAGCSTKTQRECLKTLIRQVRDLKTQAIIICQQQKSWEMPEETTTSSNGVWELIKNKCESVCDEIVEPTTTTGKMTVFKTTVRMPVSGNTTNTTQQLIKSVNNICEQLETLQVNGQRGPFKFTTPSMYEIVAECEEVESDEELTSEDEQEERFIRFRPFNNEKEESCICQIEKYINKVGGVKYTNWQQQEQQRMCCPLCKYSTGVRVTKRQPTIEYTKF